MADAAVVYVEDRMADRPRLEASTSGVAWPAIIGGAFAAVALSLILLALGSGLGLASVSPWSNAGVSATTFTVMTAVWLIVVQWLASGLGGYLTGRLRTKWVGLHTHEVFFSRHGERLFGLGRGLGDRSCIPCLRGILFGGRDRNHGGRRGIRCTHECQPRSNRGNDAIGRFCRGSDGLFRRQPLPHRSSECERAG
jgi:hypothetical protein